MAKIFRYQMLIREYHLDTFNHVNNATYLAILEEARWEFLYEQGIDIARIHKEGIGPVVLECNIKFLQELTLRESITIESQMMSFDKKIGVMRQDILSETNKVCATAQMTFGIFDMHARKLITPPERWLVAMGVC